MINFNSANNESINLGLAPEHNLTEYTITGWTEFNFASNFLVVISKNINFDDRNFWIVAWDDNFGGPNGNLVWRCSTSTITTVELISGFRVDDGVRRFFAITAGSGSAEMFINNSSVDTTTYSGTIETPSVDTNIGLDNSASGRYMDGNLEDIRIYDRKLSDAEIQTIYSSEGLDGIKNGLVSRYLLNEESPGTTVTSVKDLAGNVDSSSITGSPTYTASKLKRSRRYL